MTPERIAALVGRWVRFYTRDLATATAERRIGEVEADLHDEIAHERANGTADGRITAGIVSRAVRGVADDVAWRREHTTASARDRGGRMTTHQTTYRMAIVVALGAALLLGWGVLAMGIIGAEGDPFDLLYVGVLAIGIVGAVIARFEPDGMARALVAMAVAQAVITVIALIVGKQASPVSSVAEIVGLNGFFVALFVGAAWLFRRAAQRSSAA